MPKPKPGYKLVKSLFGKYEEIPEDWEQKQIKDLAKVNPEQIKDSYDYDKIQYVDISSIENFQITKLGEHKLNERPSRAQRIIRQNDIIISTVRPYLKSFSFITSNQPNLVCSTGFAVVRTKINSDTKLLFNYFKSHLFEANYFREMEGMAYPAITGNTVSKSIILYPKESKEREKIGNILSSVDNLIDSYSKTIDSTKKLKTGLIQTLLTRGIGHKKFKKVPYIFQKDIIIPENWIFENMRTNSKKLVVGFVGTCEPYYTDETGIPMLRTTNVSEGKLELSNLKYITKEFHDKNKKSQVKLNDLLVSRHGENGEACLVRNLKDANCLNIVIIRCNELLLPDFFEIMFNSDIIRKQIRRTTAGGVQGVVNTSEIALVKILIPPLQEQQRIASILCTIDSKIIELKSKKSNLEKLKKGLMQKLLTGQIRILV